MTHPPEDVCVIADDGGVVVADGIDEVERRLSDAGASGTNGKERVRLARNCILFSRGTIFTRIDQHVHVVQIKLYLG